MSKTTDTTVVTAVPNAETEEKKPNLFQRRVVAPIKKHPKITLAVVAVASLVGGAAYVGRVTAPDTSDLEFDGEYAGSSEEFDTTVA